MDFDKTQSIIDDLYEAARGEGDWSESLEALRVLTGAEAMAVFGRDSEGSPGNVVYATAVNYDTSAQDIYLKDFLDLDPFRPLTPTMRSGAYHDGRELLDYELFRKSSFFNDFLMVHNPIEYVDIAFLWRNRSTDANISFFRTSRQGPLDPDAKKGLKSIQRDLARVVKLHWWYARTRPAVSALEHLQTEGAHHALVLTVQGSLVFATPDGETLLREGELFRVRHGRVWGATPTVDAKLRALLRIAAGLRDMAGVEPDFAVRLGTDDHRRTYYIQARPLPPMGVHPRSVLLLLWRLQVGGNPLHAARRIGVVLGLTPAEARVAALVATGERIEAVAARLGVSVGTARNQLKAVFQKTEVHHRAALAALCAPLLSLNRNKSPD